MLDALSGVHLPLEHGQMVESQGHVELGHGIVNLPVVFIQIPIIVEKENREIVVRIHPGDIYDGNKSVD